MSDISFEEMREEVYQYLLESDEPVYHEEIQQALGMSDREIGHTLMYLYDHDRVDWPAPDKWVALPENEMVITIKNGKMKFGINE